MPPANGGSARGDNENVSMLAGGRANAHSRRGLAPGDRLPSLRGAGRQ
ncbi:hypothetical protein KCP73_25885 [Salmonella enterica subsp. enterica]|nr:hypothetical protein KCP73_25885 [Salmonella enterica subsp. enterica]